MPVIMAAAAIALVAFVLTALALGASEETRDSRRHWTPKR